MKKASASALAALVAAMTLGVAAPAGAQACPGGVPPLPTSSTVSNENGQIRINPDGPGQDVEDAGTYANARVSEGWSCAFGSVPAPAWCVYYLTVDVAYYMEYTYQDPYTGEIVIDYGRFIADTNNCI